MEELYRKYIPDEDIYLFNTGNAQKAWLCFGCVYIPEIEAHRFIVWAPNARRVSVVGDFNGWNTEANILEWHEGGVWVGFVKGLNHGDYYKYHIIGADGSSVMKTDPFAAWAQCGTDTASRVWNDMGYDWGDGGYMEKRARRDFMHEPMNIYEVHLGSWKPLSAGKPMYRDFADKMADYCLEMGYTHVELMPVTEYPYDGSWGYQVTGYYAPTSRYGEPDDLRYLVDKLHSVGVGVIMDWVPAHFPKDAHGLANFDGTRLFECKEKRMAEHPEWGTLIFDLASPSVKSFLISSACKFFEVFHIDGIRVDAVSSMLYLDYGRKNGDFTPNKYGGNTNLDAVDFFKQLNSTVMVNYPGAITVAEESTAFPLITAPPDQGGLGFCFKWDMGFMHDTIEYMSMDPYFRSFNHNKLSFSMFYAFSENYILEYSHDEVVHGKCSMINKMSGDYDQKFNSLRALYGYQFGHPGKKLTFMGSEFAQFIEWRWYEPLDWILLDYPKHQMMKRFCADLGHIYKDNEAFYYIDRSWDGFKWLNVDDKDRSSVAFMRLAPEKNSYVVCVFNFTPVYYDDFVFGLPMPGKLKLLLNSDDVKYGGNGASVKDSIDYEYEGFLDMEQRAHVALPGLSCLYYSFTPDRKEMERREREWLENEKKAREKQAKALAKAEKTEEKAI